MSTTSSRPFLDRTLVQAALLSSLGKLSPRTQARNPVMFTVWVVSLLTTGVGLAALLGFSEPGAPGAGSTLAIAAWLWATVLFANFAEAMAEGRGKAQAASLRSSRRSTTARRVVSTTMLHSVLFR